MQTVLTVSNLRIVRGARILFGNLSFTVEEGERLSLIGEPGSGRTTLFRLLNGTLPMAGGEIHFGSPSSPERPAFVPFAGASDALTSVHETVRRAADRAGIAPDRADDLVRDRLAQAGLADDGHRLIGTIDYGQRRMVEVTAAVIGDPRLLIVDDPAESVAPRSRDAIYNTLRTAAERGTAILQLTCHAEDAEALGGRVRIMPSPTPLHSDPARAASLTKVAQDAPVIQRQAA